MPLYEHVVIARQDISAQQAEGLNDSYKNVITENGGSVSKVEYWGLRSLAYKIKKNRKGHYTLFNIDAPHAAVQEMERQMSLSTDILRFMTVRVEEHEEGPSAIMRKSDRDERRPGRGGRDGGGFRGGDRGDRGPRGGDRDDRGPRGGDREDRRPAEAKSDRRDG